MATILGSRNADRLTARADGDVVEGLGGNDTLSSGTTALTGVYLFGGDGSDTLIAKASDTLIDGGAGVDTVQFAAAVASLTDDDALVGVEKVQITNTLAGTYKFSNQTEALDITGSRVVDNITGGSGNDTITGGLGADSLVGGLGDDVIVAEATDAKIDGDLGNDTVQFAAGVTRSTAGVADLLEGDLVDIDNQINIVITNTGNAVYDFDDQSEVLNITGGRGKDTITGGTAADTLSGGNGNDTLIAKAGDALVDGGAGNDTVKYDAAVATLGNAALTNVEYVVITNTADAIYNFSSQTEGLDITGNTGADVIHGGSGADALRGGLGGDTLYAGDNDKLIDGGNGADTAYFAASVSAKNLLDADLINVETITITGTGSYDFSAQSEKLVITAAGLSAAAAVTITGGKGVDTLTGGAGDDVIVASDLDVINGTSGNDTVRFAAAVSAANLGNDDLTNIDNIVITNTKAASYDFSVQTEAFNITGGSGNDTIKTATSTVDTINTGAGNDVIVAEDTDALIDGGTGIDTVQFAAAVTGGDLLDEELANVENVVITNTIGGIYDFSVQTESLQITGTKYVDSIVGGYRADTITGGEGADQLSGKEGADLLIADTSDTLIDGGVGDDTVRFAAAVTGLVDVELANVENVVITNTGNAAYDFSLQGTTVGVTENLNITGGIGNDTITGGDDADTLSGGAGNDVLAAQGTDALIDGGAGTDTVRFVAAVSAANLANADLVNVERIEVGTGINDFSVQTEALTISSGNSAVTIEGGLGADSITGGSAADNLDGNAGADTLVGGAEDDILTGGDGVDYLYGGDDDDILVAQDTDGRIDGGANNLILGLDVAQFGSSVSAVNLTDAKLVEIERVEITNITTDANYDFSAQTEALIIVGNSRADTITGTQDWDSIDGAAGNDVLSGGAGNDTLTGSGGNDILTGGVGFDEFNVDSGTDTITDLAAGETLLVASGATAIVTGSLLDLTQLAATTNSGTVNVIGTAGADVIKGTAGVDVITGGEGADTMSGMNGNNRFVIAAGDSVFTNGIAGTQGDSAASDVITDFSTSNDLIVIAGAITDSIFSVVDNVFMGTGVATTGTDYQDNINDFTTRTYLVDLDGVDTTFELGLDVGVFSEATVEGRTVLNVTGTTGNDAITGGANADTISGGEGADVITGGVGADVITGGAGTDNFVVAAIADFAVGEVVAGGSESDTLSFGAAGAITYVGSTVTSVEILDLTAGATNAVVVTQGTGLTSVLDLGVAGATLTLNKGATSFDASASGSAAAVVALGDWYYAEGTYDAVITYYDEVSSAVVALTLVGVQTGLLDGGIAVSSGSLLFTAA